MAVSLDLVLALLLVWCTPAVDLHMYVPAYIQRAWKRVRKGAREKERENVRDGFIHGRV